MKTLKILWWHFVAIFVTCNVVTLFLYLVFYLSTTDIGALMGTWIAYFYDKIIIVDDLIGKPWDLFDDN